MPKPARPSLPATLPLVRGGIERPSSGSGQDGAPPAGKPEEPRTRVWLLGLAVLLLAAIVAAVFFGENRIEDRLEHETRQALDAAGVPKVDVAFEGREATLSGTVASLCERDIALELTGAGVRTPSATCAAKLEGVEPIDGIREVDDQIKVTTLVAREPGPTLLVQIVPPAIRMSGTLRDDADVADAERAGRDASRALAADGRPGDTGVYTVDVGALRTNEQADEAPFLTTVADAVHVVAGVAGGQLEFDNEQVVVRGQIVDEATHDRVTKLLASAVSPLSVVDRMTTAAPGDLVARELGGAYVAIAIDADRIVVTGTLPTKDDVDALLAALSGLYAPADQGDAASADTGDGTTGDTADGATPGPTPIEIDVSGVAQDAEGGAPWLDDVAGVLRVVAGVDQGVLEFENSTLLVRGIAIDEAARNRILTILGNEVDLEISDADLRIGDAAEALGTVLFDTDSADIRPDAQPLIDRLANELMSAPDLQYEIVGYADSRGSEEYNQRLSEQRAQALLQALTAAGVAEGQLTARGAGEADPVGDNSTAAGREQNRRAIVLRPTP